MVKGDERNRHGFEEPASEKILLLAIPMNHGHFRKACGPVMQVQRFVFFSGGPDLVSSKLLDPSAHSLVSFRLEV